MVEMDKRDIPIKYINDAINLLAEVKKNKLFDIDILEIGCMRSELNHDIDNAICQGCCDGHSTYLFARTGWRVESVDINQSHIDRAKKSCGHFPNIKFIKKDAIEYAKPMWNLRQQIGLLFMDAWDLELPDSAEKHLEFYNLKKRFLYDGCMILIDDTDLWYDQEKKEYFHDEECLSGKGKLLIPELIKNGYEVVFKGRQTLLRRDNVQA